MESDSFWLELLKVVVPVLVSVVKVLLPVVLRRRSAVPVADPQLPRVAVYYVCHLGVVAV